MLLLCFNDIDMSNLTQKYPDKFKEITIDYKNLDNSTMIHYMEEIKEALLLYEVVAVKYSQEIRMCLDALNMVYTILCVKNLDTSQVSYRNNFNILMQLSKTHDHIFISNEMELEKELVDRFNWVDNLKNDDSYVLSFNENIESDGVKNQDETYLLNINDIAIETRDAKRLTLQQVIDNDTNITEADVREIKTISNKFKVVMILQAQNRLKTILKLLDVLDKLYDELVSRIDMSLTTTDTASLMYTADYISRALNDTNQFVMSMITNEKIQNFFIIDNSNIINISDDRLSIDKREKIRKAAEIVLENTEYFASGDFDKIVDPNSDGGNEDVNKSA